MVFETLGLLLLTCSFGNANGCNTAGTAYYMTTPLPGVVETIRKEHRTLSYSAAILGSFVEKKASTSLGYNFTTTLDFKQGPALPFVQWKYEY